MTETRKMVNWQMVKSYDVQSPMQFPCIKSTHTFKVLLIISQAQNRSAVMVNASSFDRLTYNKHTI